MLQHWIMGARVVGEMYRQYRASRPTFRQQLEEIARELGTDFDWEDETAIFGYHRNGTCYSMCVGETKDGRVLLSSMSMMWFAGAVHPDVTAFVRRKEAEDSCVTWGVGENGGRAYVKVHSLVANRSSVTAALIRDATEKLPCAMMALDESLVENGYGRLKG